MARIDKLTWFFFGGIIILSSLLFYNVLVTGPRKYDQGMTDMLDLCYDLGQATIQSKVTGKTIVCAALTNKHPL